MLSDDAPEPAAPPYIPFSAPKCSYHLHGDGKTGERKAVIGIVTMGPSSRVNFQDSPFIQINKRWWHNWEDATTFMCSSCLQAAQQKLEDMYQMWAGLFGGGAKETSVEWLKTLADPRVVFTLELIGMPLKPEAGNERVYLTKSWSEAMPIMEQAKQWALKVLTAEGLDPQKVSRPQIQQMGTQHNWHPLKVEILQNALSLHDNAVAMNNLKRNREMQLYTYHAPYNPAEYQRLAERYQRELTGTWVRALEAYWKLLYGMSEYQKLIEAGEVNDPTFAKYPTPFDPFMREKVKNPQEIPPSEQWQLRLPDWDSADFSTKAKMLLLALHDFVGTDHDPFDTSYPGRLWETIQTLYDKWQQRTRDKDYQETSLGYGYLANKYGEIIHRFD